MLSSLFFSVPHTAQPGANTAGRGIRISIPNIKYEQKAPETDKVESKGK